MNPATRRNLAYWITTALLEFELILGGIWDLLRVHQVCALVNRLGYPEYFLTILGIWKLLGAVALVIPRFPRFKEWTYAGVIFNFSGAIASHLAASFIEIGVDLPARDDRHHFRVVGPAPAIASQFLPDLSCQPRQQLSKN